ncbi:NAD(P)-dependent oxidoreductase [Vreelandella titanicae]|mgnify:FL=1|nr:NAD(P)-dependent oxidoreductase [Halomonas titanicae]
MDKVGFIGIGNMGRRMGECLIKEGYSLLAYDICSENVERLCKKGAIAVNSPAEMSSMDAVVVMVGNATQLESVLLGLDGLVSGLDGTTSPVVIIMSTISPDSVISIQERVKDKGIEIIDAPVSGGLDKAALGTLTIMAGGDNNIIDRAFPILNAMGETIYRCGPLGSGCILKLVNNMIGVASLHITAEALSLAEKLGLDLSIVLPILDKSTGRGFLTQDLETTRRQYRAWTESDDAFESFVRICEKDLSIASDLAESSNISLPVTQEILSSMKSLPKDVVHRWRSLGIDK